jgi:hypothetical protein
MKMIKKIVFLAIVAVLAGCSSGPDSVPYLIDEPPVETVPSGKAMIYFVRPHPTEGATDVEIWDGEKFVGYCHARSYFGYACSPGEHFFVGAAGGYMKGIDAQLLAGKKYYVIVQLNKSRFMPYIQFIPVVKGTRHWNNMNSYIEKLDYLVTTESVKGRMQIRKRVWIEETLKFFQTHEGKKHTYILSPSDGK